MGKSCDGGGGDETVTTRYADYVETAHKELLASMKTHAEAAVDDSPFTGYVPIEVDDGFFGAGFLISSFPSLYDMYGKFMAGLDIETLLDQTMEDTLNNPVVNDLISSEATLMSSDIAANSLPRFQIGKTDIKSVMGDSFTIGEAIIDDAKDKAFAKFQAEFKYKLIPIAQSRWQAHLAWNQNVTGVYSELIKFYFSAKTDMEEVNYSMLAKHKLWPFTVLGYQRAAVASMQGATVSQTDVAGASTAAKVLSGALSGAAMGALVGSHIATAGQFGVEAGGVVIKESVAAGTYAGTGALIGAGLGIAAALTY